MSFSASADPRITKLRAMLAVTKRITIVSHYSPDGDAIGSSLGLAQVLRAMGHSVDVIMPNELPGSLSMLKGFDGIVRFDREPEKALNAINESEVLFCLDFNRADRTGGLEGAVRKAPLRVLIDHHQDPEQFEPVMFSDTSACATCQMVYDILVAMGIEDLIDSAGATCLYTGLVTDSGSFRYRSTTPHTMRVAAKLMEHGVDIEEVHGSVMDDNSEDRMRLLGFMLSERMRIIPEYNTVVIALSQADLKRFNFKHGDTEGFVNQGLSIRGMRLAAFFIERPDMVKVSLRSKGDLYVDKFLSEHFNGGGHRNAAGGRADGPVNAAVDRFLALLPGLVNAKKG